MLLAFLLVSCGSAGEKAQVETELNTTEPGQSTSPKATQVVDAEAMDDPATIHADWAESPHADTYVMSADGKNSSCAACHAPVQWVPSMEDMPESCGSCKFEVDPPPPVIVEADWTHVECKVCHAEKKGKIQPQVLWLEIAAIEEYAEVSSHSELCLKCHLAGELAGHVSVQVQGDHYGYECTDCHQAHDTEISCSSAGCHQDVLGDDAGISGHDEDHASVSCEACHDAAGLRVGPQLETGEWTTFLPVEAGEIEWKPFVSHNTAINVDCERCHHADNPWDLSVISSTEPESE
jgi:hypothetical protein